MHPFWTKKRVVVTGASGFIGGHFVEELLKHNARVTAVCSSPSFHLSKLIKENSGLKVAFCNLHNINDIISISKNTHVIINCAALTGNTLYRVENATEILKNNTQINVNILDAAKENKIKKAVLISSAEIYSSRAKSPVREEDDFNKYWDYTLNGDLLSKRFGEILGDLYSNQYGISVFQPRPTNVYGPYDKYGNTARVVMNMIERIHSAKNVEVWGNGRQIRSFIYVTDLVKSILRMVETEAYYKLNIATDEAISINTLVKLITKISEKKTKVTFLKSRPTGISKRILDTKKLKRLIDFTPLTLEEGLTRTIQWYKAQKQSKLI